MVQPTIVVNSSRYESSPMGGSLMTLLRWNGGADRLLDRRVPCDGVLRPPARDLAVGRGHGRGGVGLVFERQKQPHTLAQRTVALRYDVVRRRVVLPFDALVAVDPLRIAPLAFDLRWKVVLPHGTGEGRVDVQRA